MITKEQTVKPNFYGLDMPLNMTCIVKVPMGFNKGSIAIFLFITDSSSMVFILLLSDN